MIRRPHVAVASSLLVGALLCGCGSTVEPGPQQVGSNAGQSGNGSAPITGGSGTVPTNGSSSTGVLSGPGSVGVGGGSPQTSGVGPTSNSGSQPGGRKNSAHSGGTGSNAAPIQLGFIVTKVSNIGQFGVSSGQTISDQQIDQSLVNAMNAHGGLDGHKIDPVYGVTDTAANSWSSEFQAACANFTQDHHVAAVVGYIFVYLDSFESCLAHADVPHLYGGYQPGDIAQQHQLPTLVSTTNPTSDVHYEIGLGGGLATGLLTPKAKLGLVLDTCAGDDQAFSRVGAPLLKAHHISYTTFTLECGEGASDDSHEVSEIGSAELHFRTSGVKTVFVEGPAALFFALAAESQGWHPTYLMTAAGAAFEGNLPTDQLEHFHGFGVEPAVDVDANHQPYSWTASERRCLALMKSQGQIPRGYNDYMETFTTCDGLTLYAAALAADGGQTAASAIVPALTSVFAKTPLAAVYGGHGRYASDEHGGPSEYRQWGWSSGCSCFRYTGPTRTVS